MKTAPTAATLQNSFHNLVTSFINGGCLTRADRVRSLISRNAPFRLNAQRVCDAYRSVCEATLDLSTSAQVITVDAYDGRNPFVQAMIEWLSGDIRRSLVGAYVHGSLATQEEIAYSDFDALVILRDEAFADSSRLAQTAMQLSHARGIMLEADPLQHHGWFVLTEADMRYYCDAYFPNTLFEFSRSLLPDEGLRLTIQMRNSLSEVRKAFDDLAASCLEIIADRRFLVNAYLTKCMLSQFMLLPSLYIHVRDRKGVYKKFSFDKARRDFTAEEWECMDLISGLRTEWHVPLRGWSRRLLSTPSALRSAIAKTASPPLPERLHLAFTPSLLARMTALIRRMQESLGKERPAYAQLQTGRN